MEHARTSGVLVDRSQPSLTVDEIVQCDYGFVPVYRGGARVEDVTRQCRNAVRSPATRCHQHGGASETSLGRTVAKARAEAERGECWPLSAEHWAQADERLAAAEGQLLAMMDSDIDDLAAMWVKFVAQQRVSGVDRFSGMNQMLVLSQHWLQARGDGLESRAAMDHALRMLQEPHMTAEAWARVGRAPTEDARPVGVLWWQSGRNKQLEQEPEETDEDFSDRVRQQGSRRGRHGGRVEYPLSSTAGEPYETHAAPLDTPVPVGHGAPEAAIETMSQLASDMGIKVQFVDARPPSGAYGYWRADTSEIVVWRGVAGGDLGAQAHVLAHELGHARLGHLTDAASERRRPDEEAAAESFAALACAHHGLDSSRLSSWYVKHWRRQAGVDMTAGGLAPLRSAVKAFDDYRTATMPAAGPADPAAVDAG